MSHLFLGLGLHISGTSRGMHDPEWQHSDAALPKQ